MLSRFGNRYLERISFFCLRKLATDQETLSQSDRYQLMPQSRYQENAREPKLYVPKFVYEERRICLIQQVRHQLLISRGIEW